MNYRHTTLSAALLCVASLAPASAQEPRAVIELFTSQGCSSCPPADKLLGELAHDPSLITLSLPVDYWDYLGWKDTLALHGHSNRERAYAEARGDREVFTPQAVVNGMVDVVGSDKNAIEDAIAKTRRNAKPLTVPVTLSVASGKVTVTVPEATDEHPNAEVWLCPITHAVTVPIDRGENNGRTLTYTNVVRRWVRLGDWSGKAATFSIPVTELPSDTSTVKDIDSVAVLVQSGVATKPGIILGAAAVDLH
jgi:hypothetical protein